MSAQLIQIYYHEDQKAKLYPFAVPHFNQELTPYFENSCIVSLVKASEAGKVAVCSWKLKDKLTWYVGPHRAITQEVLDSDYDVLSFTRNTKDHKMMAIAEVWHKGFKVAMQKLVEGIGKRWCWEVKTPIYMNHFSARRDIYLDYVTDYLDPAINFIETDPEMNKIAMRDSQYSELNKRGCVTSQYLMERINMGYYPLAPFLLERLFSVYCTNKNINVTWL